MRERVGQLSRHPRLPVAVDVSLAGAILVASLADLLKGGAGSGWGGPRPLQLLVALAISVPLLARRAHPVVVLAIVMAGGFGSVALVAPRQAAFEAFLALLVAYYSLGAYAPLRPALVTFVVATAIGFTASVVVDVAGYVDNGNGAPTFALAAAAWLGGRVIRTWRDRAAELELQRDLQARAAVAVERGRIARELHDVIAHNISMIVVQAGAASRVLEGEQDDVRAALHAIESTGRETVDEMRRLLGILRPADDGQALAPQPGLALLDDLVRQMGEAGLRVALVVEGTPAVLPPALDLSAFRIAQEGLTNVLKHAGPAQATVTVTYSSDSVEIAVEDDGPGDSAGGFGTGNGLIGMRERVALWGGRLHAGRRPGGTGWVVRAWLPLEGRT